MGTVIAFLTTLPPEALSLAMIATAYGGVLVMMRLFGLTGLTAFIIVAIIAANFQVMKTVQFSVFAHPVALGTELFTSTYLAIDVIAENYGAAAARRTIWTGFACQLLFTFVMLLTLGYHPLPEGAGIEGALTTLMLPQVGLLAAGLMSYLLSQHLDVTIFAWLKRRTGGRQLWLRNGASNIAAALLDNTVFSILAWRVFAAHPIPWDSLIFTYILGTFYIRVFVSLLDTPFIYLSRKVFRMTPHREAAPEATA